MDAVEHGEDGKLSHVAARIVRLTHPPELEIRPGNGVVGCPVWERALGDHLPERDRVGDGLVGSKADLARLSGACW